MEQLALFPEVATSSLHCQRHRDRVMSWQLAEPGERFDARRYEVHPIDDDTTAETYVVRNHYAGSYVSAVYRFGLYRAGRLVGVAVWSNPTNTLVLTNAFPELVPHKECYELGRFVLDQDEPGNTESWFIGRCHEYLVKKGVAAYVTHADPTPRIAEDGTVRSFGHVGCIYKATNCRYAGRATKRTLWQFPDGTVLSPRTEQKIRAQEPGHGSAERMLVAWGARPMRLGEKPARWLADAKRDIGMTTFRQKGVHRYLQVLGTPRQKRQVKIGLPTVGPDGYPQLPDPAPALLRAAAPPTSRQLVLP